MSSRRVCEAESDEMFLGSPKEPSEEAFRAMIDDGRARRICFSADNQDKPVREWPEGRAYSHKLVLSFTSTIGPVLQKRFGIGLTLTPFGNYFAPVDEVLAMKLEDFVEEHRQTVFIRDQLDLSFAMGMHILGGEMTELGELEKAAKYQHDAGATAELIARASEFVNKMSFLRDADIVVAVPPATGKESDLPTELAEGVAKACRKEVRLAGQWQSEKVSLKDVGLHQKWSFLEEADLRVDPSTVAGKRVILIDDLYQSGCTMQFVASRLKAAGARRIFGLALVKARSNLDNV